MSSTSMAAEAPTAAVTPDRFRDVLGVLPTGVVIVAGIADRRAVGLTIGSFVSLSLDPPLVAFAADRGSRTWSLLWAVRAFCVNVLGEGQAHLASRFARRGIDRFEGVAWTRSPGGSPILEGVPAWIDCELEVVHPVGDHDLAVASVGALDRGGPAEAALVFHRRSYGRVRRLQRPR